MKSDPKGIFCNKKAIYFFSSVLKVVYILSGTCNKLLAIDTACKIMYKKSAKIAAPKSSIQVGKGLFKTYYLLAISNKSKKEWYGMKIMEYLNVQCAQWLFVHSEPENEWALEAGKS